MAGDAIVGALRIVLGMDTGTLEDDTKKATSALGGFAKSVATIASGIQLQKIVEDLAHKFYELTIGTIEAADQMGKAAQKFGVPVEELSALAYAAKLSDVGMEQLGKGLSILSKNMETVAGSTKNVAAAAFQSLGISVRDASGHIKDSNEIFLEVADRFAVTRDGATKTALAIALFGRAGAELIPLLNQGRNGIESLADEAKKLGIVIDEDTAAAAERFNDNLKKLNVAQQGVALTILGSGGLLKAFEDLSYRLIGAAQDTERLQRIGDAVGKALEGITTWALVAAKAIETLLLPLKGVLQAAIAIANFDPAAAWKALKDAMGAAIPNVQTIFDLITKGKEPLSAWVGIVQEVTHLTEQIAKTKFLELNPFSEEQTKLAEKFKDTLTKIRLETATLGAAQLAPGFAAQAQAFRDLDGFGKSYGTTIASLSPMQKQLNQALLEFKGAQLTQDNLAPIDAYNLKMQQLQATMDAGKLSQFAFGQEGVKAAIAMRDAYGQAASTIVGSFASAFKILAEKNKEWAGIAKAAAIAEAIINTYVAANKALASPFGPIVGAAQAIAVTALGLANVAKISATNFAQGGSFTVGGSGGVDSQLVQFNATPGEMVDVRKPGQSSNVSEITVNMRGRDLISKDMIRDLFAALNEGTRDGYRLKLAEA